MLVLRRKEGERILLAGTILIEVLEVHEGKAKLGITAPPEVDIVREEIERRDNHSQLPFFKGVENVS